MCFLKVTPLVNPSPNSILGKTGKRSVKDDLGINSVTFYIHQDYDPSVLVIKAPPFELTRDGYGVFDVAVDIVMQDGRRLIGKVRDLDFNKRLSWEEVRF